MKQRTGFVSNSSSASFTVPMSALTDFQRFALLNYGTISDMMVSEGIDLGCTDEYWSVFTDGTTIHGDTVMDNFNMRRYMDQLGISRAVVNYED